ncbi:ABC transporter substrate-binding protein [Aminivibrio sp.]|uniref:ABC transporter substrate-binding protein n=1 Tax=Aminivibrio sp. TaxID=1872489 RepID=UPI001A4984E9|nr:ABC transporter substrate-binding protein [Aminivibrio sp.]MBL3538223.1 ABC transporter substrate-binding protein [Aminivibrio sp.]
MNVKRIVTGAVMAVLLAAGMAGMADAAGKSALKGTVVLYTSQPEKDVAKLIGAFNGKYPGVTVDVFRSGTEEVVSKIRAENKVKSVLADVLLVADSVTFEGLKEEGMLLSYDSPELKGIPGEYVDKDRTYAGTKLITTGIIYNTAKIKTTLTGFADLTKEEFKNNVIMPSPLYSGAAAYNLGVITRTDGLGWKFYEDLKDNGVRVEKGNGAIQTAVVAGDRACGIIVDYMAVRSKTNGAPVEFVYPVEGSPAITEPIGILKTTKVPEQAKAFVDFVLSEEGQQVAADMGYTPIKAGVPAPKGLKSISEIKSMVYDISILKSHREADKAKFSDMFQ